MRPVASSAIAAIGWDSDTETLFIEFKDKKKYPTYEFSPVNAHTAGRMFKARSIGSYYHRIIKPRNQYQTVASGRHLRALLTESSKGSLLDLALKGAEEGLKTAFHVITKR